MGLFDWLSGDSEPEPEDDGEEASGTIWLAGTGRYDFDIVGESHYQDTLEDVCGGRSEDAADHDTLAILIPQPDNPHDRNAVRVVMLVDDEMETVGYLSRDQAVPYHQRMAQMGLSRRLAGCRAKIVGGWEGPRGSGHFGVKLDLAWPVKQGPRPA